jgi:hypothetical protein
MIVRLQPTTAARLSAELRARTMRPTLRCTGQAVGGRGDWDHVIETRSSSFRRPSGRSMAPPGSLNATETGRRLGG